MTNDLIARLRVLISDENAEYLAYEAADEIERLRAALEDIAIYGCGMLSQPTGLNQPAEQWLYKRVEEYENRARAALAGKKTND